MIAQWSALSLWIIWAGSPRSVVPAGPLWLEFGLPGLVFAVLFAWSGLLLMRGTPPRGWLGWGGFVSVGMVLLLEGFFLLVVATIPAGSG